MVGTDEGQNNLRKMDGRGWRVKTSMKYDEHDSIVKMSFGVPAEITPVIIFTYNLGIVQSSCLFFKE